MLFCANMSPRLFVTRMRSSIELNNKKIGKNLKNCLFKTSIPSLKKKEGKVRDIYDLGDNLLIVTTDRLSAFDRYITTIPLKGRVLNKINEFWFEKTKHIIENAVIEVPDPNVIIMKKLSVFPVEFVVRGYITGSSNTSLWTHYNKGERAYCGILFPDGLKKNQKLQNNIVTPTTKSDLHDELISCEEIINSGLMTEDEWTLASKAALDLFEYGQQLANEAGLLLVDTKYEFGKDENGKIYLIDEIHTPDSSRYWISEGYEDSLKLGKEPKNIDKEFIRLWINSQCDPYKDVLPVVPEEMRIELSSRYLHVYELITGRQLEMLDPEEDQNERINRNLKGRLSV